MPGGPSVPLIYEGIGLAFIHPFIKNYIHVSIWMEDTKSGPATDV